MFPGRCGPGLIEACASAPPLRIGADGFRGVVAPASLKPVGVWGVCNGVLVSGALWPRPH